MPLPIAIHIEKEQTNKAAKENSIMAPHDQETGILNQVRESTIAQPCEEFASSALELNTRGVRLLQKQRYVQAIQFFEASSAQILMALSAYDTSPPDWNTQRPLEKERILLDRFMEEDDTPQSDSRSIVLFDVLKIALNGHLVLENDPSARILDCVLDTVPSSTVVFPIIIEGEAFEGISLVHHAAIISHNHCIASWCQSHVTSGTTCFTTRQDAVRLGLSASSALMKQQLNFETTDSPLEELCLTIAVLNSFINALRENEMEDKANEFYNIMIRFRKQALDLDHSERSSS